MPTQWKARDSRGRSVTITSDKEPTLAQWDAALDALDAQESQQRESFMRAESGEVEPIAASLARESLPTIAGALAPMAVPGVGVIPTLGRAAASALASSAAETMLGRETPSAVGRGMWEGAVQLGSEAAGAALKGFGKQAFRSAAGITKSMRTQYPTAVASLLERKLPINTKTADALEESIDAGVKAVDDLIYKASSAPGASTVIPADLMAGKQELLDHIDSLGGHDPAWRKSAIDTINRRYADLTRKGGLFERGAADIMKAQAVKRSAQADADAAYQMIKRGQKKQLDANELFNVQIASDLRKALEQKVPGVKDINAKIAEEIGMSRVVNDAVQRLDKHLPLGGVSDLAAMGVQGLTGQLALSAATKAVAYGPTRSRAGLMMTSAGNMIPALANSIRVGTIVTLANGRRVMVTKNDGSGQMEGVPVK